MGVLRGKQAPRDSNWSLVKLVVLVHLIQHGLVIFYCALDQRGLFATDATSLQVAGDISARFAARVLQSTRISHYETIGTLPAGATSHDRPQSERAPPAYYADRLAERGRCYLKDWFNGTIKFDGVWRAGNQVIAHDVACVTARLRADWARGNNGKNPWHRNLNDSMF